MLTSEQVEQRRREVIRAIVQEHITTGLPVGSQRISREWSGRISPMSPATVRHVMAELEEAGYLAQPHTSAGRLPTDQAYRVYVEEIRKSAPPSSSIKLKKLISQKLNLPAPEGAEKSGEKLSRLLSRVSHHVGMALGPRQSENLLEHVKLVKLPDKRILAVIVSKPDLVENKVIRIDEKRSREEMSQVDLDRAADYLNAHFKGWALGAVRVEVERRLRQERLHFQKLKRQLTLLVREGILPAEAAWEIPEVFVDGTANLLDRVEFRDLARAKGLLEKLEQKEILVKILTACMRSPGVPVHVVIGEENPDREMKGCTIVMAPLLAGDRVLGALGVLGPTRMEYGRAITAVQYTAQLVSRSLANN